MTDAHASWITLLAAPFIGKFLSLAVDCLLEDSPLRLQRSAQKKAIGLLDLLPVVGWFWSKAHCQRCGANVGGFRLALELGAPAIAVWAEIVTPGWIVVASCLLGWTLLVLAIVDMKRFILPDVVTCPLLAVGLAIACLMDPSGLSGHVVGAAVGYLGFIAVRCAYRKLRAREGLGQGDAKLLAAIGAWVSWQGLPSVVLLAAGSGALFGLMRCVIGSRAVTSERLPFGPFLAAAGWVVWLYGPLMLVGQ